MQDKSKKIMQKIFSIPQRYIMAVLMFITTLLIFQMKFAFQTVITEMVNVNDTNGEVNFFSNPEDTSSYVNLASHLSIKFDWSQETQDILLSSTYWGYVGSSLLSGIAADKYGAKHVITLGIFCTSAATLLIPLAAKSGVEWLLTAILLTGFGEGIVYPAICVLIARWIPLEERGFIAGTILAATSVGQTASTFLIGLILNLYNENWEMVYYIFGGMGFFWLVVSALFIHSEPNVHPFITDKELILLSTKIIPKTKTTAPWKKILKSLSVWAYIISNTAILWSKIIFSTYLPSYLKKILKFSVIQDSYIFSLPSLALFFSATMFGWMVDLTIRRQWLSVTKTRKLFASVAHVGNAISLLLASYSGYDKTSAVTFFILSQIFVAAYYPSTKVNVMDLSPAFAGSLLFLTNVAYDVFMIITPYLAGLLTPNFSINEWNTVFWISGIIQIASNIIYLMFGSGEVEPWNNFVPRN